MTSQQRRYLFFITKPYSLAILEPVQNYITANDAGTVHWFAASSARQMDLPGEQLLTTKEVIDYNPHAVIVPGNVVPHFWPGLKVQIFHGLGEEKKGHYRITGFFDLYCTPGPHMTRRFEQLQRKHRNFLVRETGWPKLDPLMAPANQSELKRQFGFDPNKPLILFAPTFSPKYSSAAILFGEIERLQTQPWQWLVKFHDLMDHDLTSKYKDLESTQLKIDTGDNIIPMLQASDVLLTDTSSVTYEFLPLDRSIVTCNATVRLDKGNNITDPGELEAALKNAINSPADFSEQRKDYLNELHPYSDGLSSMRIINTINEVLTGNQIQGLKRKPWNLIRKRQIRKIVAW